MDLAFLPSARSCSACSFSSSLERWGAATGEEAKHRLFEDGMRGPASTGYR